MKDRILVVEDDPDILDLVQGTLLSEGYDTEGVTSAPAAMDLVHDSRVPDLVVLDVGLPGMNGLQLLEQLRSGGAELPAVFLSARVMPDDIEAGRALGAIYLTKPFVISSFLAAVKQALHPRYW
ncbi:MAG: response regulator [Actinomycetota bacterium]|nr:response regulator [Actinomycetota bacterium]